MTSEEGRKQLKVEVFTIFPELVSHYLAGSILGRAQQSGALLVLVHDLRDGARDARKSVDDTPFGGGAGMVLMAEPTFRLVEATRPVRPLFALTPTGEPFDQKVAEHLLALGGFSLLCGRYEGIDERILTDLVDGELSIGDYVLAGGELGALVVIEAVARLVPGVVHNASSIDEESFSNGLLEHPHYTRPASFRGHDVPAVLLSGDHKAIASWRHAAALARTMKRRPDLIERRGGLSEDEVRLLASHGYPFPDGEAGT